MAKKTTPKTAASVKSVKTVKKSATERIVRKPISLDFVNKINWKFVSRLAMVVVIGLALFLVARKYRGLVLAGIVNTTPISRFELNKTMATRYGKTTLDEMINNELLKQEAAKMKISVSKDEIKEQIKQLEEKVGGEAALKDALTQYGLSQSELEEQIRMSETQRKIAETLGNAEVSDEEAQAYFKENSAGFAGKKFDEVRDQIVSNLKDQKMQESFSSWFTEVRSKANIQSYL